MLARKGCSLRVIVGRVILSPTAAMSCDSVSRSGLARPSGWRETVSSVALCPTLGMCTILKLYRRRNKEYNDR